MEAQLHTAEIAVADIDEKIHQAHSSVLPELGEGFFPLWKKIFKSVVSKG